MVRLVSPKGSRPEPVVCHSRVMFVIFGASTPHNDAIGPCWYCRHYAGPCWGDPSLADCRHDPGAPSCRGQAERGCSFWEREPGADDDGWRPAPQKWVPLTAPQTTREQPAMR